MKRITKLYIFRAIKTLSVHNVEHCNALHINYQDIKIQIDYKKVD